MNRDELIESWKQEEAKTFSGWDFSYLDGRMSEEQLPWSFSSRAAELMDKSLSALDMDTGGGEQLLELREHLPKKVVATENYLPNFKLAFQRLAPLGVRVIHAQATEDAPMDFADSEFELVLNRHAAFNANEVARILAPNGTFLTQQVHGLWADDLLATFDAKPQYADATPDKYVPRLQAAGLTIVNAQDWSGRLEFTDVGAIVYYLKAIPWLIPGFSVETHLNPLLKLQSKLERGDALVYAARKYWIEARKAVSVRV